MRSRSASTRRPRGKSIQRAYEIRDSIRAARRPPRPPVTFDKADLARALGLVVDSTERTDARDLADTGIHEAGHAFVSALTGIRFASAHLLPEGGDSAGEIRHDAIGTGETGLLDDRVAVLVAGAAAEMVAFGAIDAHGVWPDFQIAGARADGNVDLVREQIARADALLRKHASGLFGLASALVEKRSLSEAECRALLQNAGVPIRAPRFDMAGDAAEEARVQATLDAIAAHDRALAAEGGG